MSIDYVGNIYCRSYVSGARFRIVATTPHLYPESSSNIGPKRLTILKKAMTFYTKGGQEII